jgi:predicted O-methyltransferase YrrM
MISLFQVKSFLSYWLNAVDSHSLHSPFFFDLYTKAIKGKETADMFPVAEKLRKKLLQNPTPVLMQDLGAGARSKKQERTINEIARASLSTREYSQLFYRLVHYCGATNIIELGTSLGINTLYLAANKSVRVTTFEGAPAIASIAKSTFAFADVSNITLVEGDIDVTLPRYLNEIKKFDLAFIDANHRYGPTLSYVKQLIRKTHSKSIIILDDIHYTPEMETAWNEIKQDPMISGSVDLYRVGILFFDPSLNKQNVVLQFQALK